MESEAHKQFVQNAVQYIKRTFGLEENQMLIDLGEPGKTPPMVIDGFRADIYVHTPKYIIIGEAKTDNDINNKHTVAQLSSYIKEVKTFSQDRHIIMSCSWSSTRPCGISCAISGNSMICQILHSTPLIQ